MILVHRWLWRYVDIYLVEEKQNLVIKMGFPACTPLTLPKYFSTSGKPPSLAKSIGSSPYEDLGRCGAPSANNSLTASKLPCLAVDCEYIDDTENAVQLKRISNTYLRRARERNQYCCSSIEY